MLCPGPPFVAPSRACDTPPFHSCQGSARVAASQLPSTSQTTTESSPGGQRFSCSPTLVNHAVTTGACLSLLPLPLSSPLFLLCTVHFWPLLTMRDPIPAPAPIVELTKPLAEKLSLSTLPNHAHEILIGFLWYHFILYYLSPTLSRAICPNIYNSFNKRTRLNWDIHWVSMIQALLINSAALYVIFTDAQRKEMDWKGRLWGYTPASGMVQGFAAGYFLWDLQISSQYIALSGVSALLHAVGALAVTCIGFVRNRADCVGHGH